MMIIWIPIIVFVSIMLFSLIVFLIISRKKDLGIKGFKGLENRFTESIYKKRLAPDFFYEKQRTYRICYGAITALDYALLISRTIINLQTKLTDGLMIGTLRLGILNALEAVMPTINPFNTKEWNNKLDKCYAPTRMTLHAEHSIPVASDKAVAKRRI